MLSLAIVAAWGISAVTSFSIGVLILNLLSLGFILAGFKRQLVLFGVTILTVLDGVTRSVHMTGGFWRYNTFNYILLVVMLLYWRELTKSIDLPVRWLLFLVLILSLGLMVSSDMESGVQHILNAVTTFGLMAVFRQARMDEQLWFWVAKLAGLTSAVGGAVYFFGAGPRPEINPNVLATFPLTALFAHCLARGAAPGDTRGSTLLVLLSTLNLGWIFLSGSRGALLTAVLCAAYILATVHDRRRLAAQVVLISIVGAVLLSLSPATTRFAMRRVQKLIADDRSLAERTSGRSELAWAGWSIFQENPLGIGTGAFAKEFSVRNYSSKRFQAGTRREAHSAWIKILAENGVPGFLVFACFVASYALVGLAGAQPHIRWFALLTTASLATAFLSSEFATKCLWFLAAGCSVLLSSLPRHYSDTSTL